MWKWYSLTYLDDLQGILQSSIEHQLFHPYWGVRVSKMKKFLSSLLHSHLPSRTNSISHEGRNHLQISEFLHLCPIIWKKSKEKFKNAFSINTHYYKYQQYCIIKFLITRNKSVHAINDDNCVLINLQVPVLRIDCKEKQALEILSCHIPPQVGVVRYNFV